MLESALERQLYAAVRAAGGFCLKLSPNVVGTPDRLVVMPGGRMYLVELKTGTGLLSKKQVHLHAQLAELGIRVVVLYGPEQVREWVLAVQQVLG